MTDTFPYPRGAVVGVLPDGDALEDARRRLSDAGFDQLEVLHGEDGLARIDVDGSEHGRSGSLIRRLQHALSDDGDHAQRYAEALQDGRYVVGVAVGEDEEAKTRAAAALRASPVLDLHYYADRYVEDL